MTGYRCVRSWDAWLAYQVGEPDKAAEIYAELFKQGYREDDEFGVYMELLADREEWDTLDADFETYAAGGMTDSLRLLKAGLLTRRGRYEEALAILDDMDSGRVFSAELIYARIEVFDAMDDYAELAAVSLPRDLQKLIARPGYSNTKDGYGAFFLHRIVGYEFSGRLLRQQQHHDRMRTPASSQACRGPC